MSTLSKLALSGSIGGHGILITDTTSPGTTLHTPDADDTDEIWIYADSNHTEELFLNVLFGGVSDPAHVIHQWIYPNQGLQLVVPGLVIVADAAPVVSCYVDTTGSKVSVFGYVIRDTA
jgi:hypothetical protein